MAEYSLSVLSCYFLVLFGKYFIDLLVSLGLGWRMALSGKGVEVNKIGGVETVEWSHIETITVCPLKKLENGDIEVKALILAVQDGRFQKVILHGCGLTEDDIDRAFAKYIKPSQLLFK